MGSTADPILDFDLGMRSVVTAQSLQLFLT